MNESHSGGNEPKRLCLQKSTRQNEMDQVVLPSEFYQNGFGDLGINTMQRLEALHHGMSKVGFQVESLKYMHVLDTFTSFSEKLEIALAFAGDNGVIFKYEPHRPRNMKEKNCGMADISWISEFESEKYVDIF